MADDNQQTAPPQTQAPAQQTAPPPAPERREDDAPKFGRRQTDRPESCPKCGVHVERGKLGSHNFHAHGEDRRQKPRDDDNNGDKDKGGPKSPPKKDDKGGQSGGQGNDGTGTRRQRKGRWDDVRKGWG